MISVIVPVYNVEKYIDRCVESVLKQTYTDFELILIDDGSTDKSGEKCIGWAEKDSRIKIIRKDNEGLGPTRNLGVRLSKCDYITFLDSDDWWDERYLEMMMFPIEKYLVDIVCCDIHYWEIKGNSVEDKISKLRITPDKVIYTSEDKDIINRARTFAWGKVFKKSLLVDNNIEQPAHAFEDVPIIPLVVALSDTIYRVEEPLYYYYRNREGSLANRQDSIASMEISINEIVSNFKLWLLFNEYERQLKKLIYSQIRFIYHKINAFSVDKTIMCTFYEELCLKHIPELITIRRKYYITYNDILKRAVELLVINCGQIIQFNEIKKITNYEEGDVIILINEPESDKFITALNKNNKIKIVMIGKNEVEKDVDEEYIWNLSDKIFYNSL